MHVAAGELIELRDHQLAGGVDVELGVDVLQVGADGRLGHRESFGDVPAAASLP